MLCRKKILKDLTTKPRDTRVVLLPGGSVAPVSIVHAMHYVTCYIEREVLICSTARCPHVKLTTSRSVNECVDSLCDLGVGLHQTNVYLVQPRVKRRSRDWPNGLSGSNL